MLHVQAVYMKRFMSHDETRLSLPRRGVVTLAGPNGAGKSALAEVVPFALWGKTLRGASPWSGLKGGIASVAVHVVGKLLEVERTQARGLKVVLDGVETKYETVTKAQDAIEHLVGTFDVWRRCAVFSSSDAAHFSLSTDSERKGLLEQVVGLEIFDVAAERLKEQARAASDVVGRLNTGLVSSLRALDIARCEYTRASAEVVESTPVQSSERLEAARMAVESVLDRVNADVGEARALLSEAVREEGKARGYLRAAQDSLNKSRSMAGKTCPECGQPWPQGSVEALEVAYNTGVSAVEQACVVRGERSLELDELLEEERHYNRRQSEIEAALKDARVKESTHKAHAETLKRAEEAQARAQQEYMEVKAQYEEASLVLREFEAAVSVVSTRGARGVALAEAIEQFSRYAQEQVSRFAPGVRLSVCPHTLKKTGGVSETISIEVSGFGGGQYKGSSQGERRRLDVALLLALGQLQAACCGYLPGTLYADEVFDVLDTEGVETLREVLTELSRDRCVVVITHAPEVLHSLKGSVGYTVNGGKITAS